jgi:hypothetical protein
MREVPNNFSGNGVESLGKKCLKMIYTIAIREKRGIQWDRS